MDPTVESRLRTARIIHAAIAVSLLVYAGLIHLLAGALDWKAPAGTREFAGLARWVLSGLGAAEFVGVLIGRSRLLASDALVRRDRRAGRDAALVQLQTRLVILLAVAESIGIYGLILFLLTARAQDFYLLWIPSLLAVLALAPRREVWEEVGRTRPI